MMPAPQTWFHGTEWSGRVLTRELSRVKRRAAEARMGHLSLFKRLPD
jgi:hypothetical protein